MAVVVGFVTSANGSLGITAAVASSLTLADLWSVVSFDDELLLLSGAE